MLMLTHDGVLFLQGEAWRIPLFRDIGKWAVPPLMSRNVSLRESVAQYRQACSYRLRSIKICLFCGLQLNIVSSFHTSTNEAHLINHRFHWLLLQQGARK